MKIILTFVIETIEKIRTRKRGLEIKIFVDFFYINDVRSPILDKFGLENSLNTSYKVRTTNFHQMTRHFPISLASSPFHPRSQSNFQDMKIISIKCFRYCNLI